MAKKKKNRRLNIARKREKRQQNQKSRRKQLALQKQRALQTARSDEEMLQDKIMKSKLLLDEPEFENVTFDQDLLCEKTLELLASDIPFLEDEDNVDDTKSIREDEEDPEEISDRFRFEVLPELITPDFISTMLHSLKACETRLTRMGYREKAEVALVARSLFEIADPEALAFHPFVFKLCARTLEQILAHPQPMPETPDTVQSVLSDVLKLSQAEETADEQELADDSEEAKVGDEEDIVDSASDQDALRESKEQAAEAESDQPFPEVSPEDLRAKVLYNNFHGLEIRDAISVGNGYRVVEETNLQVEFLYTDPQRYITLTADRLLLQCSSKEQLEAAMEEVEELCGDALFYLAKTVDDG